MAITVARLGIAFDEGFGGNWLGPGITFICERSKAYRYFRLSSHYNLIGNTNRLVVKGASAEIGMERYGASDEVDVIRRIGIDRRAGYVGIPLAIGGERYKTVQAGELPPCHACARSGLRKCGTAKKNDGGEDEGEGLMPVVSHNVSFKSC